MLSIRDNPEARDSGGFLTPTGVPVKRRRVLGPGHPFFPRGGKRPDRSSGFDPLLLGQVATPRPMRTTAVASWPVPTYQRVRIRPVFAPPQVEPVLVPADRPVKSSV